MENIVDILNNDISTQQPEQGNIFQDYIIYIIAILIVIGIKIFLVFFSYDKKKHWYKPPDETAQELYGSKENKFFLLELLDVTKFNNLLTINLKIITQECYFLLFLLTSLIFKIRE